MKAFTNLLILGWLVLASINVYGQQSVSSVATLDLAKLRQHLKTAPMEFSAAAKSNPKTVSLPYYDGMKCDFYVMESPMLDPAFAALRPDIKTYAIYSVDDPSISGRITVSDHGLNGFLLTREGPVSIYPENMLTPVKHKVILGDDQLMEGGICHLEEPVVPQNQKESAGGKKPGTAKSNQGNGATRRTYRFAVVGTGEFYKGNGNSLATAQTAVVNTLNSIQAIYDRDLAIRFTILTPFIYPDFTTDPFVAGPNFDRITAAANAVGANFAQNDYDIGEVFHNSNEGTPADTLGTGGIAMIQSVCSNNALGNGFFKGAGWSGSFSNTGAGWINLAAHEIGHQFGASHTFNGTGSNCTQAISGQASYEIGSGSTIMSYQGLCTQSQNVPGVGSSIQYFHAFSIQQMLDYVNAGGNCAQTTPTGNTPPVVNANPCGGNYTIPRNTPFTLTGSGVDANGDAIQYTWEQYNEDGPGTPTQGLIGAAAGANPLAPLFRSLPPSASPSRNFPSIESVVAGTVNPFEALPSVGRNITFRLTGRDFNPNGGGMHCSDLNLTVSPTAGPFAVTVPNGGENWTAGNNVTVTWNVAGTNAFCNNVNIRLSTDGGLTYPFQLANNVPNAGGTWTGGLPAGITGSTTARVKVECADNTCVVFYDISNANFSITSGCTAQSSYICPDVPATFAQGAGGLNLGLNKNFGTTATGFNINVTTGSPMYAVVAQNAAGNGCQDLQTQNHYGIVQFSVDKTGVYTFNHNFQGGFTLVNIYQNAFSPTASCQNWLASSAQVQAGGGLSGGFTVTVTLNECTTYYYVASRGFSVGGMSGTVNFTGPGTIRTVSTAPPPNYAYTYAAVNTTTGTVAAVNAQSNFLTLPAGSYNVYGVSYKSAGQAPPNNVDPASLVGQTINGIYGSGACVLFSTNFKPVTVTGGGGGPCSIANAGLTDVQCNNNNTPDNPADDFLTFKLNPTGTNLSAGYTVTGVPVTPVAAVYGLATTFSRPAGSLGGGNLNLTIQDNASNTCQLAVTVLNPTPAPTLGTTTNPTGCNSTDGSVVIGGLVNGEMYNVSYQRNGAAANAGPLTANANGQITVANLGAGNYTALYVIPTGNGCPGGALTFNLNAGTAPTYTAAGTNPTGCGGTDGKITLSGLTANTAYQVSYTLNGNAVAPVNITSNANGQVEILNLGAGNFTNIIASEGGCAGAPVTATLTSTNQPVYTLYILQPTPTQGGAVWIEGAVPGDQYSITYKLNGTPVGPILRTADNIGDLLLFPLQPGSYTDVIATKNGCSNAPLSFTLNPPPQNFFQDLDNDGFSDGTTVMDTIAPPGFKLESDLADTLIDCNDLNPFEFPGQTWWQDLDGDGCGDGTFYVQCAQPAYCNIAAHLIVTEGDCNDNDPTNAPLGVPELCNGIDDNCNGEIDEDNPIGTFYEDADGDGFGNLNVTTQGCPAPPGFVDNYLDCNDNDSKINRNALEICNGYDDNCNGLIDEGVHIYFGNVVFNTQAQVDAWLPCWSVIKGNLMIEGTDITNLAALSNLNEVTGNVRIQYTSLTDLSGLDNLIAVNGIFIIKTNIYGNKLASLHGLESLSFVGRSFIVSYNFALTDCCAIHDLLNTPGAIGSLGGTPSIFYNKTGCESIPQVNTVCGGSDSLTDGTGGSSSKEVNFENAKSFNRVKMVPNPANDVTTLWFDRDFETGTIRLYDFSGKLMMEHKLQPGEDSHEVRLNNLVEGVYMMQVILDGKLTAHRLMIARTDD